MIHVQQHSETMYTADIVNYINHSSIIVLFPLATTCNLKTLNNDLQLPEPSNQWWHKTWSLFIPEGLMSHFSKSESESHLVVSDSLWPHGLYSPWNSPGQNTGVCSHSLLQGIFPTQGLDPGLLHCRRILYQHSHQGSPRILEWVAYPFSRGSSWPRNWTGVFYIAGRFFYQLSYCISIVNCIRNNLLPVIVESTKVWMDVLALETNLSRIKIIP